jgi:hypothetical protein
MPSSPTTAATHVQRRLLPALAVTAILPPVGPVRADVAAARVGAV